MRRTRASRSRVIESDLPGGHSPAYFALLNQPLPTSPLVWRNDPVSFDSYPTFFLAHEIAHQWWGQAVGWKNYHEQWLSEGFAQYFAALYAEQERGPEVLRPLAAADAQLGDRARRRRGRSISATGSATSRVTAACSARSIYNKGAMVLHMLRRLVGDEAFFAGLRQFYIDRRFRKAGTDDFRVAMESRLRTGPGAVLRAWIYGARNPAPAVQLRSDRQRGRVKLEQRGQPAPTPVTVTLNYADGRVRVTRDPVSERTAESHRQAEGSAPRRRGRTRTSPRSRSSRSKRCERPATADRSLPRALRRCARTARRPG